MRFSGQVKGGAFAPDAPSMWEGHVSKLEGKRVAVDIDREVAKRSNAQNSRFWVVIVPVFREIINQALAAQGLSDHQGVPLQLSPHDVHEKLEEWVLGFEEVPGVGKIRRRCSGLSVPAFAAFMSECEELGRERFGAVFPANPDEVREAGL